MPTAFDVDTAVAAVGPGRYEAEVTDRWSVGAQPNGGYLLAIAGRALGEALPHPHPRTITAHYLRPATPGPIDVRVETIRAGRGASTGEVRLLREGREVLRALATFADLTAAQGPTRIEARPPDLPPPDDCRRVPALLPDGRPLDIAARFDIRLPPGVPGWAHGKPTGEPRLAGWLRDAEGRDPDPLWLLAAVDAFAPPVLELGESGWVPTIELTAHVWGIPAPGWLRMETRTRVLVDGWLEEEADVWDAQDRLVARARQLALLVHPHVR